MRKKLALILILALVITSIFACSGEGDDVPEGLKIASVESECGYKFYAPEGWTVISTPEIAAARVSNVNSTSISFTEAMMPECTIAEYFEQSLSDFPESIASGMNILTRDKATSFGNADGEAYKYIYTYKYAENDVSCMQILLTHGGRFYIFTYTSFGDPDDESSYYRLYMDSVQLAIDNFRFTELGEVTSPVYDKDSDGYNLVSDMEVCGYEIYLPDGYELLFNNGFVRAKISDGANISITKATETGVGILDYLKSRRSDLCRLTTEFSDIEILLATEYNSQSAGFKDWPFDVMPITDESLTFGNLEKNKIISYEYSYSFGAQSYRVYQIMGVDGYNGYVFTYTALADEYEIHIDEIKTILEKVNFK